MEGDEGQVPDGTTSPEDDAAESEPTQGGAPPTAADHARVKQEAAKYRTDLRATKAQLKALEDQQTQRDEAEKTELQKAQDRAVRLEAELANRDTRFRDLKLEQEVYRRAAKLDIVDPDAAFRLLDKGQVVYEEDRPQNIDDLLTTLVEDKPYLKKGESKPKKPTTSTTAPDGQKQHAAPLTRADIEKMTDDEIAARYEEVQEVMATS